MTKSPKVPAPRVIRCAIYTRKSTEEGLEQEFNSLDAQRESAEAYIKSQKQAGWVCLSEHYDDGGFSGATLDRPSLKRLLADVDKGEVDCLVVYKVDRLSRSLLDFAKIMEAFEKRQVAFVSVTQQFHTATSMGRLVLNVLLSFAQFEREMISERTRDKIAAARRKGKWVGGMPLLGYDVNPRGSKLVVNEEEAARVRAIFDLYLKSQGLIPVVQELEKRGWVTKRWQTRKGHLRGGRGFTKTSLHRLLTNLVYLGKTKYKKEIHPGEHQAIIDPEVWQKVQDLLRQKSHATTARNGSQALLKGILRCRPCGCAMTPSYSSRNGSKHYRLYTCLNALKRGRRACPSKCLPAPAIENLVIEQIQGLARSRRSSLRTNNPLASFLDSSAWSSLPAAEQSRLVQHVVQRVEYDGSRGNVAITFHSLDNQNPKHPTPPEKESQPMTKPLTIEGDLPLPGRGRGTGLGTPPESSRVPRLARLMALALRMENLIRAGGIVDYSELAQLGHLSRARITQIMNLLLLAPDIQEQILFLPPTHRGRDPIGLAQLQPITRALEWNQQRRRWAGLRNRDLPR
jgi:DNA invertase Pin-like site-specific DNA recombinase